MTIFYFIWSGFFISSSYNFYSIFSCKDLRPVSLKCLYKKYIPIIEKSKIPKKLTESSEQSSYWSWNL